MSRLIILAVTGALLLTGCASVPMAPADADAALKKFPAPLPNKAGLYIYRDSALGAALKKNVSVDGSVIGETAKYVYFYKQIMPGKHTLSTESEFSDNSIDLVAAAGRNYFVRQYMKLGLFVGGAGLKIVDEEVGKAGVLACRLAGSAELPIASPVVPTAQSVAELSPAVLPAPAPTLPPEPVVAASEVVESALPPPTAAQAVEPPAPMMPTYESPPPAVPAPKYRCVTLENPRRTECSRSP